MTATTIDVDRCERGLHPATELNPSGLPVCVDCSSLVVVPLSPECKCGRGRVTVLIGFEACCPTCATEAVPEREPQTMCATPGCADWVTRGDRCSRHQGRYGRRNNGGV